MSVRPAIATGPDAPWAINIDPSWRATVDDARQYGTPAACWKRVADELVFAPVNTPALYLRAPLRFGFTADELRTMAFESWHRPAPTDSTTPRAHVFFRDYGPAPASLVQPYHEVLDDSAITALQMLDVRTAAEMERAVAWARKNARLLRVGQLSVRIFGVAGLAMLRALRAYEALIVASPGFALERTPYLRTLRVVMHPDPLHDVQGTDVPRMTSRAVAQAGTPATVDVAALLGRASGLVNLIIEAPWRVCAFQPRRPLEVGVLGDALAAHKHLRTLSLPSPITRAGQRELLAALRRSTTLVAVAIDTNDADAEWMQQQLAALARDGDCMPQLTTISLCGGAPWTGAATADEECWRDSDAPPIDRDVYSALGARRARALLCHDAVPRAEDDEATAFAQYRPPHVPPALAHRFFDSWRSA